jgi:ABC-type multidrug transport system ATPase subunit
LSLIRPNGASKTSLIRCLMNLMYIDSGEIRLFGKSHIVATNAINQKIRLFTMGLLLRGSFCRILNVAENPKFPSVKDFLASLGPNQLQGF